MEILIKVVQLIMSLSILVVLHELGHFIPAKLFKTRVEKFYLFFDPWFSLFKKKIGDTEYGLGWLPLGGYVKISGMIDESMDKEQMKKPAEDWEFRAKPTWQRLIIMVGGVAVNMILAFFIYSITLFTYGEKYLPNKNINNGLAVNELALELGFENGDKILTADGEEIIRFSEIAEKVLLSNVITIERDGVKKDIIIPENLIDILVSNESSRKTPLFSPRFPTIVNSVVENSNAKIAGLKKDDNIIGINGVSHPYFDQFKKELSKQKGEEIALLITRDGEKITLNCMVDKEGTIGFRPETSFFETASIDYNLLSSIPAGYKKTIKTLTSYIDQFALIVSPSGYKAMGGFGTIGSLFPAKWNWQIFWEMTAFLSIMLAFLNILPIPALDGGHVMFLLYEMVVGKPAPEKVVEYAQGIGMLLLLTLVVIANGNDILRLF